MILNRKMPCRFKQIVLCPPLPNILMRSDLLLERLALLVLKAIYFLLPWRRVDNLVSPSLEDTSTPSSSLRRDDTAQLSTVFEIDGTKTESCQQRKLMGLSAVAQVQRNSSSLGKGQRRNLSSMTKVFSLIFAAAQQLDSSCTDCWNRVVRFGRPIFWKYVRRAIRHWLRQWKAQAEKACEPPFGTGTI